MKLLKTALRGTQVSARRWREDFTLVAFGSNFEREWRARVGRNDHVRPGHGRRGEVAHPLQHELERARRLQSGRRGALQPQGLLDGVCVARAGDRHVFDIPSVRLAKGDLLILTHDWAEAWGLNPLKIEKFKITSMGRPGR